MSVESGAMQREQQLSSLAGWRHVLWLALLVGTSFVFTLGLACAIPFAAFAATAALTLSRRDALVSISLVWFANQLLGFTMLGYPWTASTFEWGVVLGVVAILATLVSRRIAVRLATAPWVVSSAVTFLLAFTVYEVALFATSALWLGGIEDYAAAIQVRIFAINIAAFTAFVVVNRLITPVGLVLKPRGMVGRPA
jgi:hypothetical protein